MRIVFLFAIVSVVAGCSVPQIPISDLNYECGCANANSGRECRCVNVAAYDGEPVELSIEPEKALQIVFPTAIIGGRGSTRFCALGHKDNYLVVFADSKIDAEGDRFYVEPQNLARVRLRVNRADAQHPFWPLVYLYGLKNISDH